MGSFFIGSTIKTGRTWRVHLVPEGTQPLKVAGPPSEIDPDKNIVCLISGSGFKDPVSIERMNQKTEVPTLDINQTAALLQRS